MGGSAAALRRPVGDGCRISSFYAHWHRTTPSQESGVDYYCPIGTAVFAAGAGTVVDVGGSVQAATGRYVTIDLDIGWRVRYLHLSRQDVRVGQRVDKTTQIGLSGASGYGSEFFGAPTLAKIPSYTGGPHVHTTLWPYHRYTFGSGLKAGTIDFEEHAADYAPTIPEDIDMADAFIVSHTSTDFRNGILLAAPGHWHKFTGEEWDYFRAKKLGNGKTLAETLPVLSTDGNPRAWDILRQMYAPATPAVTLDEATLAKLATAVVDKIPKSQLGDAATEDEVRKIVIDALGGLTLKSS